MALMRIAYNKMMRPVLPSYQDLADSKQNLMGIDSYLAQLKFLRVTGEVLDDVLIERVRAVEYIAEVEAALLNNGGGRI